MPRNDSSEEVREKEVLEAPATGEDSSLEVWGGRVFVFDAGGGFHTLREQMVR